MENPPFTEKDMEIARTIFNRAIVYFKIPDEPTPESVKEITREDGTIDLQKFPLVFIKVWDGGQKFLNLIYLYDGILTVCAEYNPIVAILEFHEFAQKHLKARFPQVEDDEIEKWTEQEAFYMTLTLFSRIYPRMNLSMQNFVDEVIYHWVIEWRRFEAKFNSEHGVKSDPFSEKKFFRSLMKLHEDEVVNLFLDSKDGTSEQKKVQLAKEYYSILNHWKKLRKDYVNGNPDWREYTKAGKFLDTPNDLIDSLEDCRDISNLAFEHTGRRVGLINPDTKEEDLEKRRQGINVTGYTTRQLRNLKNEGEKLLKEMQHKTAFRD